MAFCTGCGHRLGGVGRFCTNCGRPIPSDADPDTDTAVRPPVTVPTGPPPSGPPPSVPPPPAYTQPPAPRYPLFVDEVRPSPAEAPAAPQAPPPAPRPPARDGGPPFLVGALVVVVLMLVAVVGGLLMLSNSGDDEADDPAPSPSIAGSESAPPSGSPSGPPDSPPPSEGSQDLARFATVTAPRTARPNLDTRGNQVRYEPSNMVDGVPSTCWRTPGDGTGIEITFEFPQPVELTEVGLINGYAKQAGRLDWYAGNRKVLAVDWVFDDGTVVSQALDKTRDLQTTEIDPVVTSTVRLRLESVSPPGAGPAARNYTPISDVALVGAAATES